MPTEIGLSNGLKLRVPGKVEEVASKIHGMRDLIPVETEDGENYRLAAEHIVYVREIDEEEQYIHS